MDLKNETPSKSKSSTGKLPTSSINCDSPFRLMPHVSTPPSRFARILNPFDSHLLERLHLHTLSPNVFAQGSTPKSEEKFKWTIHDISILKPADIDETTISQHVSDYDPLVESMLQEKITRFFNEKAVVPSPMNEQIAQVNLVVSPTVDYKPQRCDGSAQTLLTLPPVLPKHVEDVLAPYFASETEPNKSLYSHLFDFEERDTPESSPALSTGLSPIQLSPLQSPPKHRGEDLIEAPNLSDCTLSPIGRSYHSRSACRLSFSGHMSVDASMAVPDVNGSLSCAYSEHSSLVHAEEVLSESSVNWDMEYKQVSILTSSPENVGSSTMNTPRTKLFASQRKRLSHSFKDDSIVRDVEMVEEDIYPKRIKNKTNDNVTDPGYHTAISENSIHMFGSTPTKIKD